MLHWVDVHLSRAGFIIPLCILMIHSILAPQVSATDFAAHSNTFTDEQLYRGIILMDGPVAAVIPEIRDHFMLDRLVRGEALLRAVRSFHNRTIRAVTSLDPDLLREFGAAMRSGDHLRIDAAVSKAARVTADAISRMEEVKRIQRGIREDAAKLRATSAFLRRQPDLQSLSDRELELLVESAVAEELHSRSSSGPDSGTELGAVAVLVVAITIVAVSAYVAAFNIATAINVYSAVVAWTSLYASGGDNPMKNPDGMTLLREQMIDSIARQAI